MIFADATGMSIVRIAIGLAGTVALVTSMWYVLARRSRSSFPLLFVLATVAALMLTFSLFPALFDSFMPDSRMGRIRFAVAMMSLFLIVITFESIRWTQMKERYALLWLLPCLAMLFLTAFPSVLDWLRTAFGMEYASTMAAVVFLAMMTAVFVMSRYLSRNENNISRIAQRCAMLEDRIRELEKIAGKVAGKGADK